MAEEKQMRVFLTKEESDWIDALSRKIFKEELENESLEENNQVHGENS